MRIFGQTYTEGEEERAKWLMDTYLFQDLPLSVAVLLGGHLFKRSFEQNEIIYFRNDPAQAFYLIESGRVSLTIDLEGGLEVLGEAGPGQLLGTSAAILGSKRLMNAHALSDTVHLYALPQSAYLDIMASRPDVEAKVMRRLSDWQQQYISRIFKTYKQEFAFFELGKVGLPETKVLRKASE